MDHDQLKAGVKDIAEIAASVPEQFRDKCFELLLANLLGQLKPATSPPDLGTASAKEHGSDKDATKQAKQAEGQIPITTQLRVLMKKTGVTKEELDRVLDYENGEVNFIREPHPKGIATGQMEWALLLALKNAIVNNTLTTDPEDVRSVCQEKGFYDKANFAAIFKKSRNARLFKKALVKQGPAEPLSAEGQDALGDLIRRLASENPQ
jgi:hypothetical protein